MQAEGMAGAKTLGWTASRGIREWLGDGGPLFSPIDISCTFSLTHSNTIKSPQAPFHTCVSTHSPQTHIHI